MPPRILDPLLENATGQLFWELCDFGVLDAIDEPIPNWFAMESGQPLQIVGRDACGGRFCLVPASEDRSGRLWYVDSEGSAGLIASSLSEGIQMMIALPYWRDCLKFSGGGIFGEMQKAQVYLEADLRKRHPAIDDHRTALYRSFGLFAPAAPLETLHHTVATDAGTRVVATSDGCPFTSLFNKFVVEDCPSWKQPRSKR